MMFNRSPLEYYILINSDGNILWISDLQAQDNINNDKPFIAALCKNDNSIIYCKTNKEILTLYFQGRLLTKELFMINMEGPYFIESPVGINEIRFSQEFKNNYLEVLECGNLIYYAIPLGMRLENAFESVLRYWDLFY